MKEYEVEKISKKDARYKINELCSISLNENKEGNVVVNKHCGLTKTNDENEKDKYKISQTIQQPVGFETAIALTGYGRFNYMVLLMALPASCVILYDTAAISLVLPAASCDLQLNDFRKGLVIGAIYAGMISSAFMWGYLSDEFGRKRLMVIGYFLDTICNICASFSKSFIMMLAFRFLNGLIVCGPYSTFMAYISEMFIGKPKERIIMISGIFMSMGGILQPTLAWLLIPLKFHWSIFDDVLETNSWRMFMIISTLPAFLAGVMVMFCVESPKFLVAKGRNEEALEVLRTMYSVNTGKPKDTYPVKELRNEKISQPTTDGESEADSKKLSHVLFRTWRQLTALFRPPYVKNSLIIFVIQFGALMSFNSLRLWMPLLFDKVYSGSTEVADASVCDVLSSHSNSSHAAQQESCQTVTVDSQVYINMIFLSVASNFVFILGSYLFGKIEKKYFLVTAYLVSASSCFLFVWVPSRFVLLMAAIFISALQSCTVGLLGIVVELVPTNLRAMAVSLTMMFGRLGVVFGSSLMPIMMAVNCWTPFTVIGAIILCCATGLLILTRKRVENESEPVI